VIVLDEQLLGLDIETEIAKWYPGRVCFITDLRPGTVIKDDAIPVLLHQQNQPLFVTINERDFWRKIPANRHYCIVCFAFPNARAREIPERLRLLFNQSEFDTKAKRAGMMIRVASSQEVSYYSAQRTGIITIANLSSR
jgi:hypothetical protein